MTIFGLLRSTEKKTGKNTIKFFTQSYGLNKVI